MHRIALLATLVLGFGVGVGCGEDGPEAFDTYQDCFDKFDDFGRGLPPQESILECCLLHPIDGLMPACGADKPECINYLTANLNQTSAPFTDVQMACETYANQL